MEDNNILLNSSEISVGDVVNYTSTDGSIVQEYVIVIATITDTDNNTTYSLYDTDDKLIYTNVSASEIEKKVEQTIPDIEEILDDLNSRIEEIIDENTIKDGDTINIIVGDVNALYLKDQDITYNNITINCSGSSATEDNIANAAVLVEGNSVVNLNNFIVKTSGDYSAGIVSRGSNSNILVNSSSVTTLGYRSPAFYALEDGTINATNVTLFSSGSSSNTVEVTDPTSEIILSDSTIINTSTNANAIRVMNGGKAQVSNSTITTAETSSIVLGDDTQITVDNVTFEVPSYNYAIEVEGNDTEANLVLSDSTMTDRDTDTTGVVYVLDGNLKATINNIKVYYAELLSATNSELEVELTNTVIGNITLSSSTASITINGTYTGTILDNALEDATDSKVYLAPNSTWVLTDDCYIGELVFDEEKTAKITLANHNLWVNGKLYVPESEIDDGDREDEEIYTTYRTLRVCKEEALPIIAERRVDYLYFVYDKMTLYFYQTKFIDPFCIVEELPSVPVENMIYITIDGEVYVYIDYVMRHIATIENEGQKELLLRAGTTYFMNAESRYLDPQTCTIALPYNNGTYQLSLSLGNDVVIDENTVIVFNPNTNQFEISSKVRDDVDLPGLEDYRGWTTKSIITTTDDNIVRANLKISNDENNGIELAPDGILVDTAKFAKQEDFDTVLSLYSSYRRIIDKYIVELRNAMMEITGEVSEETINNKILEALTNYESTIEDMKSKYDTLNRRVSTMEYNSTTGLDYRLEEAKQEIIDYCNTVADPWGYFEPTEYPYDISYTAKEFAVKAMILEYLRKKFIQLREIENLTMVLLEDISELPTEKDDTKLFYIYDSTTRTYTSYVWDEDSSSYIAGDTTDPYAEVEDDTETDSGNDSNSDNESDTGEDSGSEDQEGSEDGEHEGTDEDDSSSDDSSDSSTDDIDYIRYGLTASEREIEELVISAFDTIRVSMKYYRTYSSYTKLPTSGDSMYTYYVISGELEEEGYTNYQIYKWDIYENNYTLYYDYNEPESVSTGAELLSAINKYDNGIHEINIVDSLSISDNINIPYGLILDINSTSAENTISISGSNNISISGKIGITGFSIESSSTEPLLVVNNTGSITMSDANISSLSTPVIDISDTNGNITIDNSIVESSVGYTIFSLGNSSININNSTLGAVLCTEGYFNANGCTISAPNSEISDIATTYDNITTETYYGNAITYIIGTDNTVYEETNYNSIGSYNNTLSSANNSIKSIGIYILDTGNTKSTYSLSHMNYSSTEEEEEVVYEVFDKEKLQELIPGYTNNITSEVYVYINGIQVFYQAEELEPEEDDSSDDITP